MNFHDAHATGQRNPIEDLAMAIQRLPAEIRWLHAVPSVIQSHACGTPLAFGPRTRMASLLLSIASVIGVARLTASIASFILLVGIYRNQKRMLAERVLHPSIFIGVGALREGALIRALEQDRSRAVSFLNETSIDDFSSVFHVGFVEAWREWRRVLAAAWRQLGGEQPTVGLPPSNRRVEFLTQAHRYAFFRAWFLKLKLRQSIEEPIVFSAASVVAYAATSVGLKSAYHLHGFQRQSLVYPEFDEVVCFTEIEAAHLACRLPGANIRVCAEKNSSVETDFVAAIAGAYGQTEGFDDCADFIDWAGRRHIPVIVRPHPLDTSGFFSRWRSDPNVCFADTSSSFDDFIERYRPRLVLSWYSTALYDALRRGVVPVTVRTESWRPLDTVFPFQEISLRWPQEKARAESVMSDAINLASVLAEKRALAGLSTAD